VTSNEFPEKREGFAAIAIAKTGLRAKDGETMTNVLRQFGMCLPLQYLLVSCQLRVSSFQFPVKYGKDSQISPNSAISTWGFVNLWQRCGEQLSTNTRTQIHKHSVAGFAGKRVTKWYVFRDEFTNGFEGGGLLNGSKNS